MLFYLRSFFIAGSLFWLQVQKIHLATECGQEVQDQTMLGHLKDKRRVFQF